jgi:hypothetical protein
MPLSFLGFRPSAPLLPAGQKFCKKLKTGRKRKSWPGKFLTTVAENRPTKIFKEKHGFLHEILNFMSNCCNKVS